MALNMRDSLAKTRFLRHALAMLSLLFALASCDSFSLLDMLGPLKLTAATTTVARNGDPVALNVSGGEPPYSFSVTAVDLYAGTSALPIGGIYNQAYEPGGAIGRIAISVADERGDRAQVFISVVPMTPTLSLFPWNPKNGVNITWGYGDDLDTIDSFLIERSIDGAAFTSWNVFSETDSASSDNFMVVTSSTYTYLIYAVAGGYRSIPHQASM